MGVFFIFLVVLVAFIYLINKINNLETRFEKFKLDQPLYPPSGQPETTSTKPTPYATTHASKQTESALQEKITPISSSFKAPIPPPDYHHTKTPRQAHIVTQETEHKDPITSFFQWFKIDWPLKVGALFIILGFGWLLSYAFINNWIGPQARIILGLFSGSIIMVGGHWFIKKESHQGLVLEGLGAAILLVTIFAAQNSYAMFPPVVALIFTLAVSIFISFSSLTYKDKWQALAAVLIGGAAPLLTGSSEPNILNLYSYLLAISLGTVWLVRYTRWTFLTPVILAIVSFYSLSHMTSEYSRLSSYQTPLDITYLRFFAICFATMFFASNILGIIRKQAASTSDLITGLGLGFFITGWVYALVPEHLNSLLLVITALAFAVATYYTFKATKNSAPLYVYQGTAIFLLTMACVREFDGPMLVVSLSLVASIITIFNAEYIRLPTGIKLSFYHIAPILLSLNHFSGRDWRDGLLLHDSFFALLTVTASLWITGLYFYYKKQHLKDNNQDLRHIANLTLITAAVYTLLFIWRINHTLIETEYIARALTLTIYTLVGVYGYYVGQYQQRPILSRFGQILILFVISWLILVEVWDMPTPGKIITFFSIGIILILAVLTRKKPSLTP